MVPLYTLNVGISASEKVVFIRVNENPCKMAKNAF